MSAKKSGHCKELAVVERWPLVEVRLYDWKKNEIIVALHNSSLMNYDNCWIWFIILWGWSFLSPMIMLITVIFLGLCRWICKLAWKSVSKDIFSLKGQKSTWMHVESSYQASIQPNTSQINCQSTCTTWKKSTKTFWGPYYSIPPLLTHKGISTFYLVRRWGRECPNLQLNLFHRVTSLE